ncbi:hypothetical protein Naga_101893g1 [Nannochloropsis gaditana]|uniref:Uncharacterized protein n=1 Tax=Nannochloropsis gaditana TaxID=72520 RepID=W7T0F8_9STRA|nr:hypothetical protein Naga_101893g1 [Nannochloropsis gaditana]
MCLPAQFLTGVFGMNFEHFPLLKSPDGFLIFWLMTGSKRAWWWVHDSMYRSSTCECPWGCAERRRVRVRATFRAARRSCLTPRSMDKRWKGIN